MSTVGVNAHGGMVRLHAASGSRARNVDKEKRIELGRQGGREVGGLQDRDGNGTGRMGHIYMNIHMIMSMIPARAGGYFGGLRAPSVVRVSRARAVSSA